MAYWYREDNEALREAIAESGSWAEVAEKVGRSPEACRQHAARHSMGSPTDYRLWTDGERAALVRMYLEGVELWKICKVLGRSKNAVHFMANKYGLRRHGYRYGKM